MLSPMSNEYLITVVCEVLVCKERWNVKEPLNTLENWDWILNKLVTVHNQNILLRNINSHSLLILSVIRFFSTLSILFGILW